MGYDVIVIGGGPSGLMAAIAAGEQGARVLLLEKGTKLGRKLAISGGGRCNVTNRLPIDEIVRHIPGNGRFLYSAFSVFNNEDIIHFFERLGVPLKEEDHGRMFPKSDSAQSVVKALVNELGRLKADIRLESPVDDVLYEQGKAVGVKLNSGETIAANAVVVAVGGKSVPQTGSTGDGYPWAEKAGHTVTELFPTEVPIVSNEPFIQNRTLQGLSLRDVALSVLKPNGKPIITHRMDMLFTHFGISGPAALRCSQFVVKALKNAADGAVAMSIDALPDVTQEEWFRRLAKLCKEEPKKAVKTIAKTVLPERYAAFLLERSGIDPQAAAGTVSHEALRAFVRCCKQFTFYVHGTLSIDKAFVTGGGVSVKEIEPKTMASKCMDGLYFCGEILDIHGYTGGYNITAALVTGRLAGMNAARYALAAKGGNPTAGAGDR
ncbi:NAD(P)/FAD-dependent oxidoreductase [Geobacillus subterraneus]|uniref:NAD(P)/FAD-dependent oxidoreductase n=1 Tax=Geobacillus subterraneus TaxID=129338 RepID=UPI001610894B